MEQFYQPKVESEFDLTEDSKELFINMVKELADMFGASFYLIATVLALAGASIIGTLLVKYGSHYTSKGLEALQDWDDKHK